MSLLKNKIKDKIGRYLRRKHKVNTIIKSQHPAARVVINRSNTAIRAQIIDAQGKVLGAVVDSKMKGKTKTERAHQAGMELAKLAATHKIKQIAFDRNGFLYHGRVKAVAEGLREGGLTL